MRRIELEANQAFEERLLNRTSAFNADGLVAARAIVEAVRERGDAAVN